ncbi:MAG TPA: lactonase family protein [Chitinophagaceae bacterium]
MRILGYLLLIMTSIPALSQQHYLFVGTYTATGSKGIYVYRFDAGTGALEPVGHTDSASNPSFLALHPGGNYLYACNENNPGAVSAFAFDRGSGRLTFLNGQPSGGAHPAYVAVDRSGQWLLAGNYSGGNLSAFPINGNGSLQPFSQLVQHRGSSVDQQRQTSPHVHATLFGPGDDYVYVPDLGMDKVMVYKFDKDAKEPLEEASPKHVKTEPGSGPRHLAFHPNGRWAYLMEEMGGTVSAYRYKRGALQCQQRIAAHPDTAKGPFGSADIHVSPDGRFLYASNRASENNLAIFAIDERKGTLRPVGYQSTLGEQPRNFTLDPSGRYLLAANQRSGTVVVFRREAQTGLLQPTGVQVSIPQPVCLLFHR